MGGSSLGGLVTLYLGMRYPDVYGKLAVFSPSVWWRDRVILKYVERIPQKTGQRIWLDIGTNEGRRAMPDVRALKRMLVKKGWRPGKDLEYREIEGGKHSEYAWAERVAPDAEVPVPEAGVEDLSGIPEQQNCYFSIASPGQSECQEPANSGGWIASLIKRQYSAELHRDDSVGERRHHQRQNFPDRGDEHRECAVWIEVWVVGYDCAVGMEARAGRGHQLRRQLPGSAEGSGFDGR